MPGVKQIEDLTGVPVLGVMPWLDVDLEEEDSVAMQRGLYRHIGDRPVTIAVAQLPHLSNFTDLNALAAQPDVRVRYVRTPEELADADLIILPGSKNTLGDLNWLRQSGLAQALLARHREGTPVMGICGGYQMLGETITDEIESGLGVLPGLGLLATDTLFAPEKTTEQTRARLQTTLPGWLAGVSGMDISGYEIHMGTTTRRAHCRAALELHRPKGSTLADGAVSDDGLVFGTYLHGLFDSDAFTRGIVNALRQRKGLSALDVTVSYADYKAQQFDILANAMREHIDIEKIYQIMHDYQEPQS